MLWLCVEDKIFLKMMIFGRFGVEEKKVGEEGIFFFKTMIMAHDSFK
jgi:hypothetical protein